MTKLLTIIALAGALLLGTGCNTAQAVPKASFKWNPKTGDVEIISPKDAELKNVVIMRGETNGMKFATILIGEYRTSMNPEVVKESAAGTAAMINAGGDLGVKWFTVGLQTAAQAAGVPRPAQSAPPQPTPPAPIPTK